jgi:hypothetical protein
LFEIKEKHITLGLTGLRALFPHILVQPVVIKKFLSLRLKAYFTLLIEIVWNFCVGIN